MQKIVLISAIAAMTISTSSAAAAQEFGSPVPTLTRSAAFVGAQARLSLGTAKPTLPVARLTAGMTNLSFSQQGALVNRPIGTTFELGISRTGRTDFYVGGHRYSDLKAKLGIAPVGIAVLAIGGLAVVGAGLAGGSSSDSTQQQKKQQPEVVCLGIGVCPPLPKPGG